VQSSDADNKKLELKQEAQRGFIFLMIFKNGLPEWSFAVRRGDGVPLTLSARRGTCGWLDCKAAPADSGCEDGREPEGSG
jgi:hypothetical protein